MINVVIKGASGNHTKMWPKPVSLNVFDNPSHVKMLKILGALRGLKTVNRNMKFARMRALEWFGPKCAECGVEAQKYVLCQDTRNGSWSLQAVYKDGLDKNGKRVLRILTLDHIIPLAKGGSRWKIENHQILCGACNNRKADKI